MSMAELISDLDLVAGCVGAGHMDAACNQWHLSNRALPSLEAMARDTGEPRLHEAAAGMTTAARHFDAAKEALLGVLRLVSECTAEQRG
jgi:hypothetical protein